jgi:hypothetical protein
LVESITAALTVAAVLGIWFATTRWIAIAATSLLCFVHPWLALFVVVTVGWAFYFFRVRK